jgi:large subunit ribosomal protein L3
MKYLLGQKVGMTQIFDESGQARAATVVNAGPLKVIAHKTAERDGYSAAVFGYGTQAARRLSKPVRGQQGLAADAKTGFRFIREARLAEAAGEDLAVGQEIGLSTFQPGDMVVVSGVSKGRGFQGVVKRHGFHGGSRTHGQKHSEREPGSIGGGLRTRVPKGMRMAGRQGSDRVSIEGLEVLKVDEAAGQIWIGGALPGRRGTLLEIKG